MVPELVPIPHNLFLRYNYVYRKFHSKKELYVDEKDSFEFEIAHLDEEDELDVEIVDLADGDEFKQDFVPSLTKLVRRTPRFTSRQRRKQLLVTVSIVSLLLCVLLGSYAPMRNRLAQTLIPSAPTSTAKVGPSIELFYFDANPTWGQLFIDGKRVTPVLSIDNASPLRLARGRHSLRWVVPPFVPQLCTVSVPFNIATDTCLFDRFTRYPKGADEWLFRFPMSLAQLPHTAFSDLVEKVQTELDAHAPSETVLPGETYAVNTTGESMRRAIKPLKATLRYQLDIENTLDGVCSTLFEQSTPCTFNGQECYLFCTISTFPFGNRTRDASWDVFAAVQASWEYSTLGGTVLAYNQPELLGTTVVYDHLLPLHITWDGTNWHVTLRTSQPQAVYAQQQLDVACNTALNTVKDVLVPTTSEQAHSGINWQYVSTPNPADGCLSIATLNAGQGSSSSPPVAYCLHRFGVFLAANAVAHHYWPDMPVADAHEQQFAQQLAASQDDS